MIRLDNSIWIGDSHSPLLIPPQVTALLNVAVDLSLKENYWPAVEYAHVGLVDGPGNSPAAYIAAVLALADMSNRRDTLICCHSGSRALAIVIMLYAIQSDKTWDNILEMFQERVEHNLPEINPAHEQSFKKISWKSLRSLIN